MDKQKVLIVHNYYQIPGGEDIVVANEKRMLEENGHEVILYSRHNSEIMKFSLFKKYLLPLTSVFNLRTYNEVKKIIKSEQINIVHVHNTLSLISPSVYYSALSCKVPVVQTVHNFRLVCPGATFYREGYICEDCVEHGLWCAVKHGCYRGSRLQTLVCVVSMKIHRMMGVYGRLNFICLTKFNKEKLLLLNQVKPEKVFVKPNFVDSVKLIIPYEKRENQFVFAGRLDKLKGIDILLEAWKMMGYQAPKLIICGTGPMGDWCEKFIDENELKSVEMKGYVDNTEVRKIIGHSKALILPTQWYEGFPMTIVEAFSVGTPVIGSDLGNVGNIVIEGVTGAKFIANSPEALMKAMNRIGSYPEIFNFTAKEFKDNYSELQNYNCITSIYSLVN